MTKRDYERAATIVQRIERGPQADEPGTADSVATAFCELFADDNPRFDEARFRAACVPGNNVRARPRKREVA